MSIKTIRTNTDDLKELRELQGKQRDDCIAAFTIHPSGKIWPFVSQGNTPPDFRALDARGHRDALDPVAKAFMCLPNKQFGGRAFIDEKGAFYRPGNGRPDVRFVEFEFAEVDR